MLIRLLTFAAAVLLTAPISILATTEAPEKFDSLDEAILKVAGEESNASNSHQQTPEVNLADPNLYPQNEMDGASSMEGDRGTEAALPHVTEPIESNLSSIITTLTNVSNGTIPASNVSKFYHLNSFGPIDETEEWILPPSRVPAEVPKSPTTRRQQSKTR